MNSGADVRKAATARLPRMLEQLGELVETESPSDDPAALVAYPAARDLPQPPT